MSKTQKAAANVIKAANELHRALKNLREAAIVAQDAYADCDQYRALRGYHAVTKVIDNCNDALADAVQIADIGSMDAEKAMAGFPIHKAEESCIPAWMQGHPVELD